MMNISLSCLTQTSVLASKGLDWSVILCWADCWRYFQSGCLGPNFSTSAILDDVSGVGEGGGKRAISLSLDVEDSLFLESHTEETRIPSFSARTPAVTGEALLNKLK